MAFPFVYLIKYLFPNPQEGYSTDGAEDEVGEVALAKQFDVQQMADKGADIAANDTNDKIHTASFALTTHNTVSYVTNEDTREYRPCRKVSNMF